MSEQRYITFVPQEDNVNDPISADDINELQDAIEEQQMEDFRQADADFVNQSLFNLKNHPVCNSMFLDLFEDDSKINFAKSSNIRFAADIRSVIFDTVGVTKGVLATTIITNPTAKPIRQIILLVNEFKPTGSDIQYEFTYDGTTYYPLVPNVSTPLVVDPVGPEIQLRVTFTKPDDTVEPRLDGWAVLYQDETYMFRFLEDGLDINIESAWDGTIIE